MGRQKEEIKDGTSHGTSTGSHPFQVIPPFFFFSLLLPCVSLLDVQAGSGFLEHESPGLSAPPTSHLLPGTQIVFSWGRHGAVDLSSPQCLVLLQGVSQTAPRGRNSKAVQGKSTMAKQSPTPWHHSPAALPCAHTRVLMSLLNLRKKKSLINLNDSLDCIHIPGNTED